MPRYQIDPKYTYSGAEITFDIPSSETTDDASMLAQYLSNNTKIITPLWPILDKYADSSVPSNARRQGSKVQMTSLRLKGSINLNFNFLQRLYLQSSSPSSSTFTQWPTITYQFFNMRFFLIKWSSSFTQQEDDSAIREWFLRTFVYYGQPTSNQFSTVPSVHEKLMRMSTEYTGQFQILADKCFTLTSKHPVLDIDWVIPLRERLSWDPDSTSSDSEAPQQPRFSIIVLGPYNPYIDMDPSTRNIFSTNTNSSLLSYQMLHFAYFKYILKMNFIDL